jgi:hypothetical protein
MKLFIILELANCANGLFQEMSRVEFGLVRDLMDCQELYNSGLLQNFQILARKDIIIAARTPFF